MEMSASKRDVDDLRRGNGKIYKSVEEWAHGVDKNHVQPIIVINRGKSVEKDLFSNLLKSFSLH